MLVPFTVNDLLDGASLVYGARVGFVDEPNQPAASPGETTYSEVRDLAYRQAARLDELGLAVGDRVGIVSQNSS